MNQYFPPRGFEPFLPPYAPPRPRGRWEWIPFPPPYPYPQPYFEPVWCGVIPPTGAKSFTVIAAGTGPGKTHFH